MNKFFWSFLVGLLALAVLLARRSSLFVDSEPLFPNRVPIYGLTKQIDDLANKYLGLVQQSKKDFPDGWNRPAIFRNGVNTKKWLAPKVFASEQFWKQEMQHVPMVGCSREGTFSYFKMDRPLSKYLAERTPPMSPPRRNLTGEPEDGEQTVFFTRCVV